MASKFGLGRGLADIQAGMGAIPDISICNLLMVCCLQFYAAYVDEFVHDGIDGEARR